MGKLHTSYKLTIETMSPLHIGTGIELLHGFDYVIHDGNTWVLDKDRLAEYLLDNRPDQFNRLAQGFAAGQILSDLKLYDLNSGIFSYVLEGMPQIGTGSAPIREQIKDTWGQVYIPGSSVKGALRTAIAFAQWKEKRLTFHTSMLKDAAKSAAQQIEHDLLVVPNTPRKKAPNYDLMRAIYLSDSEPRSDLQLKVEHVQVVGGRERIPIYVETIPRGSTFTISMNLDGYLTGTQRRINWTDSQRQWLEPIMLMRILNDWTEARIRADSDRPRTGKWERQFAAIAYYVIEKQLAENECIIQLGWGTGWDSKTLGSHLTRRTTEFYKTVRKFEKAMDRKQQYREGQKYPKTRHVCVEKGQPVSELGWVKLKIEQVA